MVDRQNCFDQPVKWDLTTIGQGDDYATGSLLNYPYF